MKKKLSVCILTYLAATHLTSTSAAATSYSDNGDSWAKDSSNPACGKGKRQSPIDLSTTMQSKQEEYFVKHYDDIIKDDDYPPRYGYKDDFKNRLGTVYYSQKSSAIYSVLDNKGLGIDNVPTPVPESPDFYANTNWFNSSEGKAYEADPMYYTKQLHFHAQSEHTIDGKLMDLEMHIVHQSANKTANEHDNDDKDVQEKKWPLGKLAVIGVMFDTKNYDEVSWETVQAIDNFFESLEFGYFTYRAYRNSTIEDVKLGELMAVLNTSNRWVYSGSLTTPPCIENVYWNVIKTVYPIKPEHLIKYWRAMEVHADPDSDSVAKGNYRKARQPSEDHKLRLLRPLDTYEDLDSNPTAEILAIVLACAVLMALYFAGYLCWKSGQNSKKDITKVMPQGNDVEMRNNYMTANDNSTINVTTVANEYK